MTSTATITKKSSELTEGDVVLTHGMRVLLGPVKRRDDVQGDTVNPYGQVTHSPGTVLNREELDDQWLYFHTREGWTIQGNDLVSWTVEVPTVHVVTWEA